MQSHESAAHPRAALAGIRVLDLADNAVAHASRLLADLGAEVIRIEPPAGSALRAGVGRTHGSASSAFSRKASRRPSTLASRP